MVGEQPTGSGRMLWRFYGWLWGIAPWTVAGLVAVSALPQILVPVQLIGVQRAVDGVVGHEAWGGWLALVVLTIVAQQLVQPLMFSLQGALSDRIEVARSQEVLEAVCSWPGIARFEDSSYRDDLARATALRGRFGFNAVVSLTAMGSALVAVAAAIAVLAGFVWWLPIVVVVSAVPPMLTSWRFEQTFTFLIYDQTPESRRLTYLRDLHLDHRPAKDLRLAGAFGALGRRYDEIFSTTERELRAKERPAVAGRIAVELLASGLLAGALLALLLGWVPGSVSAGQTTAIVAGALAIRIQLDMFGQYLHRMPHWLSVLGSMERITGAAPDLRAAQRPHTGAASGPAAVEFERVWFTYPGAQAPAVRDVSLRVEPGETVALVGHNGSGKTTLVKLLLRFYDVDSGRITVDGVDVRQWDVDALRRRVGALFQDFARFELTAGLNIGLGDVDHVEDAARIEVAARAGNATAVVELLPQGYDTRVGALLGGRELSGGQWQRLALSRAAMSPAGLMVLDEPTAQLDPRAEAEVFERFAQLGSARTVLLVSHRYSTVALADRIVLLADGRVRELGSHAELLAAGGEYARQFRLQAALYLDARDDESTEER